MLYINEYDQVLENKIEELYTDLFPEFFISESRTDYYTDRERDSDVDTSNPNIPSSRNLGLTVVGSTVGGVTGATVGTTLRKYLDGDKLPKGKLKNLIVFGIAGAAIAAALTSIYNIVKKKKKIKELIAGEKDASKKASLNKQLNQLSTKEVIALKNYKKQQELAKLKADTKLADAEKQNIKGELSNAAQHAKKIEDLKNKIKEER